MPCGWRTCLLAVVEIIPIHRLRPHPSSPPHRPARPAFLFIPRQTERQIELQKDLRSQSSHNASTKESCRFSFLSFELLYKVAAIATISKEQSIVLSILGRSSQC